MRELTSQELQQIQGGDYLACVATGAVQGAILGAVYGNLFGPAGAFVGSVGWSIFYAYAANC